MAAEKITVFVKVGFTETEAKHLKTRCSLTDRAPSEYIRVHCVRPHLYGCIVKAEAAESDWIDSAPGELP
jgi:hypothetical protein